MNITPITKKYTNPCVVNAVNFASKGVAEGNARNNSFCNKTIVKNTLNEFSNSRGNFLADIDLTDIYIPQSDFSSLEMKNINFLADMPLCDAYELPENKCRNLQLPFGGAYPQYLIDQDAVEQYEVVSNGIQDIAKSTYCSFGNASEKNILSKVVSFVKKLF